MLSTPSSFNMMSAVVFKISEAAYGLFNHGRGSLASSFLAKQPLACSVRFRKMAALSANTHGGRFCSYVPVATFFLSLNCFLHTEGELQLCTGGNVFHLSIDIHGGRFAVHVTGGNIPFFQLIFFQFVGRCLVPAKAMKATEALFLYGRHPFCFFGSKFANCRRRRRRTGRKEGEAKIESYYGLWSKLFAKFLSVGRPVVGVHSFALKSMLCYTESSL